MKLPFHFDSSYPLTLGVADDYFTLSTRLKRLKRAPHQPRPATTWLVSGALLISFAAVLPFELRARAQSAAKNVGKSAVKPAGELSGTVKDASGRAVAGATVYVMEPMDDGGEPRAQTRTDDSGKFALRDLKIDRYGVVVFVDAGRRGVTEKQFDLNSSDDAGNFAVKLPQPSVAALALRDQQQRPVKGVEVRLGRVGGSFSSWMAMPRAVKARYRATSDGAGVVKFPPLPLGMLAQFELADQVSKPTKFGLGDLRGARYAPLAAEDAVRLDRQGVLRSIDLVPPIRLEGRVTTENGNAKGNVLILAHRVNAAQQAGDNQNREPFIAQTRSNAQGKYAMDGLRPGRYYVWVYPEKRLVKEFIGPSYQRDLKEKINRVDFKLSRGALIQGVVISQSTKKPVKGQTMWLFDSQENNQYAITDARGYFKFRALGGKQRLRVHENGSNSPPPGFFLPAKSDYNFAVANGQKRDFKIELPGRALAKNDAPIGGVVLGPDGAPLAGAQVAYRSIGDAMGEIKTVAADKNGRFTIVPPFYASDKPLQLWADAGELTTPQAVVATRGQKVSLELASGGWASIAGRIVDENQKPLAGAKITQFVLIDNNGTNTRQTLSDARGHFAFERVRPGVGSLIYSDKAGYTNGDWRQQSVSAGQRMTANIVVQRAPKTLSGTIIDEAGRPAKGYQVWATGQRDVNLTRGDGKFYSPQVVAGPLWIAVTAPRSAKSWIGFQATGGDTNVVIRLSEGKRVGAQSAGAGAKKIDPVGLVGKPAPPILAVRWSNGRARPLLSLRGQTVLLAFDFFGIEGAGGQTTLRDVARSQKARFQTIGVQLQIGKARAQQSADEVARDVGIPIAVDAVLASRKASGWQTFEAYGQARYAVIGRDGKILYAGDKIERAIAFATGDNSANPAKSNAAQLNPAKLNPAKLNAAKRSFLRPATAATGTVTGTARDENGRPLAGVNVWAYTQRQSRGIGSATFTTGKDGQYRFDGFPAGGRVAVIARREGYGVLPTPTDDAFGLNYRPLAKNQTLILDATLRVAPATLAGAVFQADGMLATNYHIAPQNMRLSATTKANGKFWMPGVWSGARDVYVFDPMSRKRWGPYRAQNNQRDLKLRLSEKRRDKNYVLGKK